MTVSLKQRRSPEDHNAHCRMLFGGEVFYIVELRKGVLFLEHASTDDRAIVSLPDMAMDSYCDMAAERLRCYEKAIP